MRMVRRVLAAFLLVLPPSSAADVSAHQRADRLDPQPRSRPSHPRADRVNVREVAQGPLDNALLTAEHSGDKRAIVNALLDLSRFNRSFNWMKNASPP